MAAFIEDGYTIDSVIPKDAYVTDPVEFTFRPATSREYRRWVLARQKDEGAVSADAIFIASHIVKWNVTTRSGNTVEITPENCDRLHPNVASPMLNQIVGDSPPGVKEAEAKGN